MTKQDMLKNKIELAITACMINTLLYARDKKEWKEVVEEAEKHKKELYEFIAGLEPKQEGEVV